MSANRLCSTALSARNSRWSTTGPASPRDRREGDATLVGMDFRVIDTAGYEDQDAASLPGRMRAQTEAAVAQADVALFLIDARVGLVPLDEEIARWLRGSKTPVILVANKAEGRAGESGILESLSLGFGDPVALSAEHGEGMVELFEALLPHIEKDEDPEAIVEEIDEESLDAPLKLAHHRPPQCRQIDPDQPHARRGAADHRPGGRDHPRLDRDRLDLA